MRAWDKIINWGRGLMQRAGAATGLAREYRDIFDLGGVPAFKAYYQTGIFVWKALYRGYYEAWHLVPAPTVASAAATRRLYRLNAAKAVCAELAGLVWGEQAEIRVAMTGWEERRDETTGAVVNPDPLNAFVQDVLRANAFGEHLQPLIEQAMALGGGAVKVWAEPDPAFGGRSQSLPSSGGEVARSAGGADATAYGIKLGYVSADQFVPLSWDNAAITEGVFISRSAKGKYFYTRLEWQRVEGGRLVIENQLYRSDMESGAQPGKLQDILGARVPLSELYPDLEERVEVAAPEGLFSYFRAPVANNLGDGSPLGMSIYGNAMETLHALDICYDSFVSEFRLGKKRIIVPARCVRQVVDPVTGIPRRYFDPSDEVYEAFAADDKDELKISDDSVALRVEEHIAALNAFLNILCLQVGFSAGSFSFDNSGGVKTATEVVSENSKTFKTLRTVKNQLAPALEKLVRQIVQVAALYGIEHEGQSVAALAAGGFEVKITFDDSVTQDRATNLNEGISLVNSRLLSKFTFLTDPKYGIGLTEAEAKTELERINEESRGAYGGDLPPLA